MAEKQRSELHFDHIMEYSLWPASLETLKKAIVHSAVGESFVTVSRLNGVISR